MREKVVDVFRRGKFKFLTLTEMKLKGNGEIWFEVNDITAGFQEKKLRKVWPSCRMMCGTVE